MQLFIRSIKLHIPPSVVGASLLTLIYAIIRWNHLDYVPMWDAMKYYTEIMWAQEQPFNILNYSESNHIAQSWFLIFGLPNYFFPHFLYMYALWVAILSTTSVVCSYYIIRHLVANRLSELELFLAGVIFAIHPSLLCNLIHTTTDSGLIIFATWYLLALLNNWRFVAAISGCLLLFDKDPGIALTLGLFTFRLIWEPLENWGPWLRRNCIALIAPYMLLAVFLGIKGWYYNLPLFWEGLYGSNLTHIMPDSSLTNYLMMAFILNFNWVLVSSTILLAYIVRHNEKFQWSGIHRQTVALLFLFLFTCALVFIVRHWSNLRYLVSLLMVIPLLFFFALSTLPFLRIRLAILSIIIPLLAWQDVRSVDPISNQVFSYFDFGSHRLLYILTDEQPSFTHMNMGMPRDQLVYNLEFTVVERLLTKIFQTIRPNGHEVFTIDQDHSWYLVPGYRLPNYTPSFARIAFHPIVFKLDDRFMNYHRHRDCYFIAFPHPITKRAVATINTNYKAMNIMHFDIDGYHVPVYHFTQKTPKWHTVWKTRVRWKRK